MATNLESTSGQNVADVPPSGGTSQTALPRGRFQGNLVIGIILGAAGFLFGHYLGNAIASSWTIVANSGANNVAVMLGYIIGTIGFLLGMGIFNYPIMKIVGLQPANSHEFSKGPGKYFRYTPDHKVVGVQYLAGMLLYFFTAGLYALAIRTELLSPTYHIFSPGTYIEIVGEHGTMMMMMMTSVVTGPFGNYLVPIMIGSRRMAFPRLEAVSFWLTPPAYIILLSDIFLGGFPTGWTGYAPLANQATLGMDSYVVSFSLMAISLVVGSINLIATIVNFRAPGMRWSRLPMLVWGVLTTAFLTGLAPGVLFDGLYMMGSDRTANTALFVAAHGGSPYLWENLFWFFGHPEVYILALPGFAIASEILPVFARKPLFGYRTSAAGLIGVGLLSWFVWQHHLFDSGMNPDMRPVFMLTTEMISIPTGIIYMVAMGTLWRAKLVMSVPVLFILMLYFNFLLGGISGVYLSDVPADVTAHGSFFVMAHFHYTIMGGLIFAVFGAVYYWLPKMSGIMLNTKLGYINAIAMFIAFNSTFLPLFAVGELGQPRRVFEYAPRLQFLNDWVSISAYCLGAAIFIFVINVVYSLVFERRPCGPNPWNSRGLEWMVSSPPPADNFDRVPLILAGPYDYGDPNALPVADLRGYGAASTGSVAAAPVAGGE